MPQQASDQRTDRGLARAGRPDHDRGRLPVRRLPVRRLPVRRLPRRLAGHRLRALRLPLSWRPVIWQAGVPGGHFITSEFR